MIERAVFRGPIRTAAVLVAALTLAACSSTTDEPGAAGSPTPTSMPGVVTVAMFRFQPSPITVEIGTTVRWMNTDQILHTATAGAPDAPSGVFDQTMDGAGTSGAHTFTEAGSFPYFCSRHPSMLGEVVVTAG